MNILQFAGFFMAVVSAIYHERLEFVERTKQRKFIGYLINWSGIVAALVSIIAAAPYDKVIGSFHLSVFVIVVNVIFILFFLFEISKIKHMKKRMRDDDHGVPY
ncbi:MAG: hypothetical protein ACOZAK_01490 [Patescibacteria group bacterium]